MENKPSLGHPFVKICLFIISSYFFIHGIFLIQGFLIPLLFGIILSMLVLPVCNFMEKLRFSRGVAILMSILIIILFVSTIIFLLSTQVAELAEDLPFIQEKFLEKYHNFQIWIQEKTNISIASQAAWIQENYTTLLSHADDFIAKAVLELSTGLGNLLLVVIYMFFFLLFRERIRNFFLKAAPEENHNQVKQIIAKTQHLAIRYLSGLLVEVIIFGTLASIGFLILGIKQPFFWGYTAGILNLIPYLGALIGSILPLLIAFIYKDSLLYPLGVLAVIFIVQFIDNNVVVPRFVAGYIRINALATVVVIIAGGAIWGIAGMVLFLPLLGIAKIVMDTIPSLQPFGYLIGEDDLESTGGFGTKIKDWIRKKRRGRKDG
ncbi:MAG: AI-2E family transporter [Cytophagaceae bacterium]